MVYDRSSWCLCYRPFGCLIEDYQGSVLLSVHEGRFVRPKLSDRPDLLVYDQRCITLIASAKVPGLYETIVKQALPRTSHGSPQRSNS